MIVALLTIPISLIDPPEGPLEQVRGLESQAIARAHRLGQRKHIEIVRFAIQGTEEEAQLALMLNDDASEPATTNAKNNQPRKKKVI